MGLVRRFNPTFITKSTEWHCAKSRFTLLGIMTNICVWQPCHDWRGWWFVVPLKLNHLTRMAILRDRDPWNYISSVTSASSGNRFNTRHHFGTGEGSSMWKHDSIESKQIRTQIPMMYNGLLIVRWFLDICLLSNTKKYQSALGLMSWAPFH